MRALREAGARPMAQALTSCASPLPVGVGAGVPLFGVLVLLVPALPLSAEPISTPLVGVEGTWRSPPLCPP